MNHIMAVYDESEQYAAKLTSFLNLKENFPFEVISFKDTDRLREYSQKKKIDVALISEKKESEIAEFISCEKMILLTERGTSSTSQKCIYKYQSCESMIRALLSMMAERDVDGQLVTRKSKMQMIGFYSPIKRVRQTTSAIILGQLLSKKGRTLYINMEGNSGINALLCKNDGKDMADLFYCLQQKKDRFLYVLECMTEERNGLYILPPLSNQMDLMSITDSEWLLLLQAFEKFSNYEYLVIDLSDSIQKYPEILRQCRVIYTIEGEDICAREKLIQYHEMIEKCGYEDVWEKTKCITLPKESVDEPVDGLFKSVILTEYFKQRVREDLHE